MQIEYIHSPMQLFSLPKYVYPILSHLDAMDSEGYWGQRMPTLLLVMIGTVGS